VVIASDAMIEAALLPPDRMKVRDLPLEGSDNRADSGTGSNTREDMHMIRHS
jgi:hypothetical protein